jgi:DNA-binding CsgD family transcriptional regulator
MRKLDVKTQPQLVQKLHALQAPAEATVGR